MSLKKEITSLEKAIRTAGADLDEVLRVANVDRSTWTRWKSGAVVGARYDTIERVRQSATKAIARATRQKPPPETGAAA